jgi:homocysteine S-methyltransferase
MVNEPRNPHAPGNPFAPFLAAAGVVILDGALATELERRGADLQDALWSAKTLLEAPALIQQLHYDYLVAGADVITTASYQATFAGYARRGLDAAAAEAVMLRSVALACAARSAFWQVPAQRVGRIWPLVAASIGPYGAFLANGAEYSGDYRLTCAELIDFHRPRLALFAASAADLLACETIPSMVEAEALVRLLAEFPRARAWLSFSCRDSAHLHDGTRLAEAVKVANGSAQVVAVGVNCTAPDFIEGLLDEARPQTHKPILVYPNRGETWDAVTKQWRAQTGVDDLRRCAQRWHALGAAIIGGCCRTTPDDIAQMAAVLRPV